MGYTRGAEPFRTGTNTIERAVAKAIDKHVVFPIMEREHHMLGSVEVSFVVDGEGRLKVLSCRSGNQDLAAYVQRKLEAIQVPGEHDGIWRTSHVRFVFRPEQS